MEHTAELHEAQKSDQAFDEGEGEYQDTQAEDEAAWESWLEYRGVTEREEDEGHAMEDDEIEEAERQMWYAGYRAL